MTLTGVFAGTYNGDVFHSADGATWEAYGSPGGDITSIALFHDAVFVTCGQDDNIYRTTDGTTWASVQEVFGGVGLIKGASLAVYGSYLYGIVTQWAGDYTASSFRIVRTANGTTWGTVYTFTDSGYGGTLIDFMSEGNLYVGAGHLYAVVNGACWYPEPRTGLSKNYFGYEIYHSANGTSWSKVANVAVPDSTFGWGYDDIFTLAFANGKFLIASDRDLIYGTQAQFNSGSGLTTASTGYLYASALTLNCGDWSYYDDGGRYGGMAEMGGFRYHLGQPVLRASLTADDWTTVYAGYFPQMCMFAGNLYGASTGIAMSDDNGETFELIDDDTINGVGFSAICAGGEPIMTYAALF